MSARADGLAVSVSVNFYGSSSARSTWPTLLEIIDATWGKEGLRICDHTKDLCLARASVGQVFIGTQKRVYYAGTCLEAVGQSHDYDGRLPLRSLSRHVCSSTRAGAVDWMKSTSTSKRCEGRRVDING